LTGEHQRHLKVRSLSRKKTNTTTTSIDVNKAHHNMSYAQYQQYGGNPYNNGSEAEEGRVPQNVRTYCCAGAISASC